VHCFIVFLLHAYRPADSAPPAKKALTESRFEGDGL